MNCPQCDKALYGTSCPCGYTSLTTACTPIRSTERAIPNGSTLEDFGVDLFAAIKVCTGILQLQELQQKADTRRSPEYQQRELLMLQQLAALVPKLSVGDQEQLIERYPRLFT